MSVWPEGKQENNNTGNLLHAYYCKLKHSDKNSCHTQSHSVFTLNLIKPYQSFYQTYLQDLLGTQSNQAITCSLYNHIQHSSYRYRYRSPCSLLKAIQNFSLTLIYAGIIKHNTHIRAHVRAHTHTLKEGKDGLQQCWQSSNKLCSHVVTKCAWVTKRAKQCIKFDTFCARVTKHAATRVHSTH